MRVLVLNGSPKGKLSVTLHTVMYLQNNFKDDVFEIVNIGVKIKQFEKDFTPMIDSIKNADLILFSYPVYTFLAPYQLHKFIELFKKWVRDNQIDLSQKFATQISTSKHFYDTTAHQYIEDNCQDLGLKTLKGLSADMNDLLNSKGQEEALSFWKLTKFKISQSISIPKIARSKKDTINLPIDFTVLQDVDKKEKLLHKDIVIVTDVEDNDLQLKNMIHSFQLQFPYKTKIINLHEFPFLSGCLGCFKCATSGNCVIPDRFDSFLRNEIQKSDAIVYAFSIKDHSMGSLFKLYDDRQFCNGHRTVSIGMPIGYIISGSYSEEYNLQTIIDSRAQVGQQYLAGIATDDSSHIEKNHTQKSILDLVYTLEYALENQIKLPQNFYGIGGLKIFRDLIYETQGLMREDYKFYQKNNFFDFPHKNWKGIWYMKAIGFIMANKTLNKKYAHKMNDYILKPYQDVVNKSKE